MVLFKGISFISTTDIFTRWVPLSERVRAVTISTLGQSLGSAITYPISGFIIQYFGWKYIFYFSGKRKYHTRIKDIVYTCRSVSFSICLTQENSLMTNYCNSLPKILVRIFFIVAAVSLILA